MDSQDCLARHSPAMAEKTVSDSRRRRKADDIQHMEANMLAIRRQKKKEKHVDQVRKTKVEITILNDEPDPMAPVLSTRRAEPEDVTTNASSAFAVSGGEVVTCLAPVPPLLADGGFCFTLDGTEWPEPFLSGSESPVDDVPPYNDGEYNFWTDSYTFPSWF
ncbi:hypothetical protein PR202_ga04022 [Eleusine coracana subsp. coracana]|uniref:BZIP domain-containing protein n=1 Tax=Eleusine coracana subsp. coracana TaxID=191504 RepID=A0AAV5BQY6_ELECO|nr:hypothetical protein PR202_ga04022 [Eleusine coracana subsp. coracana]